MIAFTRRLRQFTAAAALAGLCTAAALGQEAEESTAPDPIETSSAEAFDIPANVTILGKGDPNARRATAIVNGSIITGTDIDHRTALILAANEATDVPEEEIQRLRLQVLRNLIDETLQIQEAAAQDMAVTRQEVNETYTRVSTQQYSRPTEAMDAYLLSVGSSPNSLKRQIEGELAWDRLLRRNVAPFVNVSTGEVNELVGRLEASRGTSEYRIGEIYLSATPETRAAVDQNARRIVDQIRQGGSFVAYARQFSEASTAAVGGDLGWIRLEQLQNPQLEEVASQLSPGQLVGPIEIPGGFSILYLIERRQIGMTDPRDAVLSLKQISIEFPQGLSEDEARARATAFAEGVDRIRGCGEAESAGAAMGAQVVTNDELSVRALPEQLQASLLELSVGEYFGPFGALDEGVRVLMLCGRDDPEVQGGPNREQIMAQMEDDRINKRAQRYLRDLRRDAVIEYN